MSHRLGGRRGFTGGALKRWPGSTAQGQRAGVQAQVYMGNERVRYLPPSQIFPTFRKTLHG